MEKNGSKTKVGGKEIEPIAWMSSIEGLSETILWSFDLGNLDLTPSNVSEIAQKFEPYATGAYAISTGELKEFRESSPTLLKSYASMYEERIRLQNRTQRSQLIVEFPRIACHGLRCKDEEIVCYTDTFTILPILSVHSSGVACLSLWLEEFPSLSLDDALLLRMPDQAKISADIRFVVGEHVLRCYGDSVPLSDLAAMYILLAVLILQPRRIAADTLVEKLKKDKTPTDIYSELLELDRSFPGAFPFSEAYTIFHINRIADKTFNTEALRTYLHRHSRELRALITGDKNWDKKTDEIVNQLIPDSNLSSRHSLAWFVTSEGALKIYSADLETELETSRVLIAFELELIRTMHFLLEKISYNLDRLAERKGTPQEIAALRDIEFRRLNDYYNLDMCQKDTTASRIEKCIELSNIPGLLEITKQKFENLMTVIDARYQKTLARRQQILSLIFGVFGTGVLSYEIIRRIADTSISWVRSVFEIGTTAALMAIVFFLIYYFAEKKS